MTRQVQVGNVYRKRVIDEPDSDWNEIRVCGEVFVGESPDIEPEWTVTPNGTFGEVQQTTDAFLQEYELVAVAPDPEGRWEL